MQATTLQCQINVPNGLIIPIMFYSSVNGALPEAILFRKPGDIVDLNRVDIPSFIQGLTHEETRRLLASKALALVVVEVPEKIADAVRNGLAKYNQLPSANKGVPHNGEYQVVELEPGVQVAVGIGGSGGGSPVESKVPSLTEVMQVGAMTEVKTAELEPGVQAPPIQPVAVTEESTEPEVADWKANKTFDEQKKFLMASQDVEFLKSVAEDSKESLKLRKVAKERLATLNK